MTLFERVGANSSPEPGALADVLSLFGAVADAAAGSPPEATPSIASLAVWMARLAELSQEEADALYFAALLRNLGALGNPAFGKGEPLPARLAEMHRWDIPVSGARLCESIRALPRPTADLVRWSAERWDGTGYPDQLRWHGIPRAAQALHLACTYVRFADREEALATIAGESGQAFAPEQTRTFVLWYHACGGEIEPVGIPLHALDSELATTGEIVDTLADRIDAHNGTPGRWRRVLQRAEHASAALQLPPSDRAQLACAVRFFAAGEIDDAILEAERFGPMARLGVKNRAKHAVAAAALLERSTTLGAAAPLLRARAEWYDGTGKPDGLRHEAIPPAAMVLSACIAYDALEQSAREKTREDHRRPLDRIETASGTQFDPRVVSALAQIEQERT